MRISPRAVLTMGSPGLVEFPYGPAMVLKLGAWLGTKLGQAKYGGDMSFLHRFEGFISSSEVCCTWKNSCSPMKKKEVARGIQ